MENPSYIPGYKDIDDETFYRPLEDHKFINNMHIRPFVQNPNFKQYQFNGPYIKEYYEDSIEYQMDKHSNISTFHPCILTQSDINRQCNPLIAYPYGVPRDVITYKKCTKCKGKKKNPKHLNKKKNTNEEEKTNDSSLDEYNADDNTLNDSSSINEEVTINKSEELPITTSLDSSKVVSNEQCVDNSVGKPQGFCYIRDLYNIALCRKKKNTSSINSVISHGDETDVHYTNLINEESNINLRDNLQYSNENKFINTNNNTYLVKNECNMEQPQLFNKQKDLKEKIHNINTADIPYKSHDNGSNTCVVPPSENDENDSEFQNEPDVTGRDEDSLDGLEIEELLKLFETSVGLKKLKKIIKKKEMSIGDKHGKNSKQGKNSNESKHKDKKEKDASKPLTKRKKTVIIRDFESLSNENQIDDFALPSSNMKIKFKNYPTEKNNNFDKKANEKKEIKIKNSKTHLTRAKSLKLRKGTMNFSSKNNNALQRKKSVLKRNKSLADFKVKKQQTMTLKKKKTIPKLTSVKETTTPNTMNKKKTLNKKKSLVTSDNKKNKTTPGVIKTLTRSKTKVYVDDKTKDFKQSEVKMVSKNQFSRAVNVVEQKNNNIKQKIAISNNPSKNILNTQKPVVDEVDTRKSNIRTKVQKKKKELISNIISQTKNMKEKPLKKVYNDQMKNLNLSVSSCNLGN